MGIKFFGILALLTRTVRAFAPATEGHMIIGTGGRQIDHYTAGSYVTAKMSRTRQIRGDDAGGQSKTRIVHGLQRLFIRAHFNHANHRRKKLFAVHLPVVAGTSKYRRGHEISFCRTLDVFTATA
jgi:hypothetical protein